METATIIVFTNVQAQIYGYGHLEIGAHSVTLHYPPNDIHGHLRNTPPIKVRRDKTFDPKMHPLDIAHWVVCKHTLVLEKQAQKPKS